MPQPTDFRHDVFLSHTHVDKLQLRRLSERLKVPGSGANGSMSSNKFSEGDIRKAVMEN